MKNEGYFYYVGNIVCDISGITRKSTAENLIGAADFLISLSVHERCERNRIRGGSAAECRKT